MMRTPVLLAALALAACATTPPSRFYTLSGAVPPVPATSTLSIAVGPVTIPAAVDRPEIVIAVSENEVWLDEYNRWAGPLGEAIAVAAAEDLAAALGTLRATAAVQAATDADYRVSVEVQRFESAPGAYALLDAVFTVRRTSDGRSASGRTTAREVPQDKSYAQLAAAHSRAVARLAQDIAATTRTLAAQAPRPVTPNR